jgi:hypothetical protein
MNDGHNSMSEGTMFRLCIQSHREPSKAIKILGFGNHPHSRGSAHDSPVSFDRLLIILQPLRAGAGTF